jgi:sporulation protein YlmC with PRC-barrel domain
MDNTPEEEGAMTGMTGSVHKLVPSDRVEGTPVSGPDGKQIGTVERLMIDKRSGQIAYAVLRCGGFLGVGEEHVPVPWNSLKYNIERQTFELGIPAEKLRDALVNESGEEFDLGSREPPYRHPQYWGV